jgi:ribulose-5-phosphate 4-epimerase/fuculose-1-phosphate aldolase
MAIYRRHRGRLGPTGAGPLLSKGLPRAQNRRRCTCQFIQQRFSPTRPGYSSRTESALVINPSCPTAISYLSLQILMSDLSALVRDLVVANRILARENVVDAYGHVSVRHPDNPQRFLLATSVAPEMVEQDHIIEFNLDCTPVRDDGRPLYHERFIHGGIYQTRPDVQAVVHAHAEDVLPFSISATPLLPVIHSGSFMGAYVPVWDMADRFGRGTNMLVTNMEQARDLACCLGSNSVVLMRGHGFSAAARSLIEAVRMAVYVPRNARVQMNALRLGGEVKPLHDGEITARNTGYKPYSLETRRAWLYWAHKAGCAHLVPEQPVDHVHKPWGSE